MKKAARKSMDKVVFGGVFVYGEHCMGGLSPGRRPHCRVCTARGCQ